MNDKPNGAGLPYWNEEAEKRVPFHLWIATQYMHSMTEIYEYYRGFGVAMPKVMRDDLERIEKVISDDIQKESGQGGKFHDFYKERVHK